jgi:glycosyltransferase involved in cell wall biosynthesis
LGKNAARKKILVLTSTFPRWEDDVEPPFVYELCRRLSETFFVHVLAPHTSGAAVEEQLDGIQVTRYRYFISRWESLAYCGGILAKLKQKPMRYGLIPFFILAQLLALVHLLQRCQYDCIHAHWMIPQGLTALIARFFIKSAPPLIVTSHGSDLFGLPGSAFNIVNRLVVSHSHAVTVVSSVLRDRLVQIGASEEKIHIIPMGTDLQKRFTPATTTANGSNLLYVGRLNHQKGVHNLLDALPPIITQFPEVKLRIAGDGTARNDLEKKVVELGLEKHVRFLGAVSHDRIHFFYRKADILIFPSLNAEGFGLVLVEALGCECAVIATDLPAVQHLIKDGETGLIVSQNNKDEIAQRVMHLLSNPGKLKKLGKSGREFVLKRYDWGIIAKKYSELLQSITTSPGVPVVDKPAEPGS